MLAVSIIALVFSVVAVGVSFLSVYYTRRQAHAAEGETAVAVAQDRRSRMPVLSVSVEKKAELRQDSVIYEVRNDGPQPLDSVVVTRPEPADGITYEVARVGTNYSDEADLGPLGLTQSGRFTLSIGVAETLPKFWVLVRCVAGDDTWDVPVLLDEPRRRPTRISRARMS